MTDPRPLPRRAIPTAAERRAVFESANGRCTHCGATDVPLEIRFITPLSEGGGPEHGNLEAVCPNCHRVLDSEPSELFFARFVADLLESHPAFADVIREPALGNTRRSAAVYLDSADFKAKLNEVEPTNREHP